MTEKKPQARLFIDKELFKELDVDKNKRLVITLQDLPVLLQTGSCFKLDIAMDDLDKLLFFLLRQRDEKDFFEKYPDELVYFPKHLLTKLERMGLEKKTKKTKTLWDGILGFFSRGRE